MKLKEKTLKQNIKFSGQLINVRHDEVELPNNKITTREVVEHPGGVAVAMCDEKGDFFLVTQYRYAQQKEMIEFPAGKLEKGENPFVAIQREIAEETGYEGKDFIFLGTMVPTGAYLEERITMYYAKAGKHVGQNLDEDEFIRVTKKSLNEIIEMIFHGEIEDGKTIAMAFMIKTLLARSKK